MSNENESNNIPNPKSTLEQLKEWQELLAYLAAGIGPVLGIFFSSGATQIVSTVLAAVVLAGGKLACPAFAAAEEAAGRAGAAVGRAAQSAASRLPQLVAV